MAEPLKIEVFRVGGAASRHVTTEALAEVATFDCAENPIPICFGHPASDTPAAGVIEGFEHEGSSLFAKVKSFSESAIEGIRNGEWINRSMAFFDPTHEANPRPGKWSPRHLGLLGGAAPGIPGMGTLQKALAFNAAGEIEVSADPADAVVYAGKPTPVHFIADPVQEQKPVEFTAEQKAENDRLAALAAAQTQRETEFAAREAKFAADMKAQRETSNAALVDGLVADAKVLPAEAPALKLVFNALGGDVLEFSAEDKTTPAAKLATFLSTALPKRVPVGNQPLSPSNKFSATDITDPNQFNARVDALAKEEGISISEATARLAAQIEA